MTNQDKRNDSKGAASVPSILVGVLVILALLGLVKYFQDRDNDITIHVPKVEVR